jgi:uncharacterized heparinase superfamily protein
MFRSIQLYWHTLRYLRPIQFAARASLKMYRPGFDVGPAPATRSIGGKWVRPARRLPSMLGPMMFRLLNHEARVGQEAWEVHAPSKLWAYQVNYFDDLNAFDANQRVDWHRDAIASWIKRHPPGPGQDAWAPYPISIRMVNWIKWILNGNAANPSINASLATQARALVRRLEYHLLGNHIFTNAKALVFAGLYFDGDEAERWLNRGLQILQREFGEQILRDGGHFERSTMYQLLALEDVLDLINIVRAALPALNVDLQAWPATAQSMLSWAEAMTHPDGELSFFNDSAMGIAPRLDELRRYANELLGMTSVEVSPSEPVRIRPLLPSGYVRADADSCALLLDVAPIGPDYLPGHAHADTLSFELSLYGQRVIVNRGTSLYGSGAERDIERGTAAHSTVTIDQHDSSEVWAGFRVARRARPCGLEIRQHGETLSVSCAHDGYLRLSGKPLPRRHWRLSPGRLVITDQVQGKFDTAVAHYHLHPGITALVHEPGSGKLVLQNSREIRWHITGSACAVEASFYSPEFGKKLPSQSLVARFRPGQTVTAEFEW